MRGPHQTASGVILCSKIPWGFSFLSETPPGHLTPHLLKLIFPEHGLRIHNMFYVFFTLLSLGTSAYPWLPWIPVPVCFAAQEGVPYEKVHYLRKHSHGQFVLLLLGWESLPNCPLWSIRLLKCNLFIQQIFSEHLLPSSKVPARCSSASQGCFQNLPFSCPSTSLSTWVEDPQVLRASLEAGVANWDWPVPPQNHPNGLPPGWAECPIREHPALRWVGANPEQAEHFSNLCESAMWDGVAPFSRA